jgi:hypothetical protein
MFWKTYLTSDILALYVCCGNTNLDKSKLPQNSRGADRIVQRIHGYLSVVHVLRSGSG